MNKKAQVSIYIAFMISAIFIVLVAAVFAPMGTLFNTEMYKAGEDILLRTNDSIQGIQDADVKAAVQGHIDEAIAAAETNVEVNADIFKYGWVLVIALTAVVVFLFSRRINEIQGGLI